MPHATFEVDVHKLLPWSRAYAKLLIFIHDLGMGMRLHRFFVLCGNVDIVKWLPCSVLTLSVHLWQRGTHWSHHTTVSLSAVLQSRVRIRISWMGTLLDLPSQILSHKFKKAWWDFMSDSVPLWHHTYCDHAMECLLFTLFVSVWVEDAIKTEMT